MANNRTHDAWLVLSNYLFLTYVRERLGKTPAAWGGWGSTHRSIPSRWPFQLYDSPQAAATRIAVQYKNQFAADLAELPDLPAPAYVRAYWLECMQRAERAIADQAAL